MALRFSVTAAAAPATFESNTTPSTAHPAKELVRIGISTRRSNSIAKCFVTPVRPTLRCRAVATNYLEEESEVLDIESEKEEDKVVAEEEVSPLTPTAFEVPQI